jgi:hypothetical protein
MIFLGFMLGMLTYVVTVFPAAALFGFEGDTWMGICMLWGVVCGGAGTLWGLTR